MTKKELIQNTISYASGSTIATGLITGNIVLTLIGGLIAVINLYNTTKTVSKEYREND